MSKFSELWLTLHSGVSREQPSSKSAMAFGFLVAAGVLAAPLQAQAAGKLRVDTKEGPVKGVLVNGVAEYLGIPYAEPPVGKLRWMPPKQHAPWTAILKATAFGPACAQFADTVFAGPANNNEDCLYVNVFTPNVDPAAREKLPVMFWSYGGGDTQGESNDYDASKLAAQGHTVVVTFNYRLNLFGFMAHPALDNEGHLFGNYGILDNQFALKWVKRNIANFGGDPNNVTIMGQSAGATNTSSEVLSPLAKGLFTRAIFESGALPSLTPLLFAEAKGVAFSSAAGCGSGTDAATAKCLRSLTAAQVESLAGTSAYLPGEIADGQIEPTVAITAYETGNFNHVPLMIGNAENEGNFFIAPTEYNESPRAPITEAQFAAFVTTTYGGNAGPGGSPPAYPAGTIQKVLAQYPLGAYPSAQLQLSAAETDGANLNASPCKSLHLDQVLATQVPVYAYEFRDQTAPFYYPKMPGFQALAYHTADIQYLFPLFHGSPLGIPHELNRKQEALSDQLVAAWTNFAWTGNPNGQGNKPWPRYKTPNGLILSEDIAPAGLTTLTDAEFAAEHKCNFWNSIIIYKSTMP